MGVLARISAAAIDAVIFDLDGVVTDTASVHSAAWKRLFDAYLQERAERTGDDWEPFEPDDYRRYVDGKPRYDGVRSFLAARGITLPEGETSDPPDRETVRGLGNRKDREFLDHIREHGVDAFPGTVRLIDDLHGLGVRTAIISASRNCQEVLRAAGLEDRFEERVDGLVAAGVGLPGKPDPAVFLEAARRLGVPPFRAASVEDALAGVEAGRRGGFALVIGVDRTGHAQELREHGADVVVSDLGEMSTTAEPPAIGDLPDALDRVARVATWVDERSPAVFLDYDGTLTPIVPDPDDALLSDEARAAIRRLAEVCTVGVISGRDLDDVRGKVALDELLYAGSHGFDIVGPDGLREQRGTEHLPALDEAEADLRAALENTGTAVERKRFAVAVHFRRAPDRAAEVERAVKAAASAHRGLRVTGGKMIFELRPDVEWDKGLALSWLLEVLGLEGEDVLPMYLGDDVTDEDAFRALGARGVGLVVRGEDDTRPTLASLAFSDPGEVRSFLDALAEVLEE
ncbi:MAG TPA: trehalose-phosphatase [Actinomycetota bacterium]